MIRRRPQRGLRRQRAAEREKRRRFVRGRGVSAGFWFDMMKHLAPMLLASPSTLIRGEIGGREKSS